MDPRNTDSLPKGSNDKVRYECGDESANQRQGDFQTAMEYHEIAKVVGGKATEGSAYGNLGIAHQTLGDLKTATDYHEHQLKIAKNVGDKRGEGKAYSNLGNAHQSLCDFKTAADYHERHLKIAKEVGDKGEEGKAYANLGNAYKSLGDFKTAIDYYQRALKMAKQVGHKVPGGTYANLGNAYQSLGDFKTAIDYHEGHLIIAKEVGDKDGVGKAYNNLGNAYQGLGDFKTAIDHYQRALKIAKEVGDKVEEKNSCGNLGSAHESLGDFQTAIAYHQRALKMAKEVGDKDGVGKAYNNLGNVYQGLGDFKTAIDYYQRCLKMAKEVGNKVGKRKVYGNLGNAYSRLGDFYTAIDYHQRALKFSIEIGDKVAEGGSYGNLGNAYQGLGDFKTAIDYHEGHLIIAKEVGDKNGVGKAYGNLGNAYQGLGEFKTAIDYHEGQLIIAKEVGDKDGIGKAYGNLGIAYQSLGDFKTAIDYHERHLIIAKEVGDKVGEGNAYGSLGNAYGSLGGFKIAIEYQERSLKIAKEVGDKVGTAKAFYNLATFSELLGFLPKALECLYSSVKIFNIIRHDLKGKDEWKIRYRNMHEIAYSALWRLLLKQGKVAEALSTAEQARAQALNDLMELNYGFEATYSQLHTREESTYDSIRFPLSTAVFMAIAEREIVFWVVHDKNDVELRRKELRNHSSVNLKYFLASLIATASLEISGKAGIKCEDRSLDTLGDEQVVNRRSPQTLAKPVSLEINALRMLYDAIIEPIADLIHGNELILVPEGPLCLAPYAAFMDSYSKYLCDVCRIRVLPSFSSLKMIRESPDGFHSKTGVLLVGDPWVQEIAISGKILEQLPWARKEVLMIGRICKTEPLIGRDATKSEVLRRLPSVALIHIAAHGRMETGEIALAPNTTRASQIPGNEDFLLTMKDVLSVRIRAKLVVLSCCHSGRGEIKAEGVVGIARAFLGAGARAVLVSLWAIDDVATLEFMQSFYSHLEKGISASESLNKAMKHMKESDKFSEVKHWAPFVLIGDDVTLEFSGNK